MGTNPRLDALQACTVLSLDGQPQTFSSLWSPTPNKLTLLIFFTHWADLGSWEFAQRLNKRRSMLEAAGAPFLPSQVQLGSQGQLGSTSKLRCLLVSRMYRRSVAKCRGPLQ